MTIESSPRPTIGVLAGWQLFGTANTHNYLDSLFRGIRAAARDHNCNLLLACGMGLSTRSTRPRPAWPIPGPEVDFIPVGPWNTAGLIVVNPLLSHERTCYIKSLMAQGHPVVFVGEAEGTPAVTIDNESGIRQAMTHLVAHGHRAIAFIAGSQEDMGGDSGARLRAYRRFVDEYSLVNAPELVAYGAHIVSGGREAMQCILGAGVPFTAVLASNDESAVGAIQALQAAGLNIPQDMAVIGFDNRPLSAVQHPPLTTVHSPTFERGYCALELLLARIAGKVVGDKIISTPAHLVVRQSCGCQPEQITALHGLTASSGSPTPDMVKLRLVQAMSTAVLSEARRLGPDEIRPLCQQLVEAFIVGLEQGQVIPLRQALSYVLHKVEEVNEDAHIWQTAVLVLVDSIPLFLTPEAHLSAHQHISAMLHQAQLLISESVRRQYRTHLVVQGLTTAHVGILNARLLTAVDEHQIYHILAEHLADVGIHTAVVGFFQPEEADPFAWSLLQPVSLERQKPFRLRSREFPPPQLYQAERPFHLALVPLAGSEGQLGFVAFEADNLEVCDGVTRQLAAALRSTRLYREARHGRQLAEEANRLKSRFLSAVSHELRTPLSLIVGLSEGLVQDTAQLPADQAERIRWIHASAQHVEGLIRDVLDLARSEINQLELTKEPLDLIEMLDTVLPAGQQMVEAKGLAWQVQLPSESPPLWGDQTRLRQIVLNLLSNAVKFTDEGIIRLHVEVEGKNILLAVSDTGVGIPAAEQQAIFEEFRQSEHTGHRGYRGLGLGLAICQRLVTLHGGEIWAESPGVLGIGSTFYVRLPVIIGSETAEPFKRQSMMGQDVMVLIEEPEDASQLQAHLERQGFAVHLLSVKQRADWWSQMLLLSPDAVILEMGMAASRGWEILRLLKESSAMRHIPVLFYALAPEQDNGAILALDYLDKPMGTAELAQALQRYGLPGTEGDNPRTILVVDDEPGILALHAQVVEAQGEGYTAMKARNGREAMEQMRQKRPDLVLLDLMMPEMDGFAVLEAMQADATLCNIPVIVLTSQILTREEMERLNQGVTAVLKKGVFSTKETIAHIENALARHPSFGHATQRLMRQAMAYVHEHYAEPITRQDIADTVGVSPGYLSRCFHQQIGLTPTDYLNRYRVSQAKKQLKTTDAPIGEVATAVGFSDQGYFSRIFRREVGMPPGDYRRSG